MKLHRGSHTFDYIKVPCYDGTGRPNELGDLYFDTGTGKLVVHNGTQYNVLEDTPEITTTEFTFTAGDWVLGTEYTITILGTQHNLTGLLDVTVFNNNMPVDVGININGSGDITLTSNAVNFNCTVLINKK